MAEDYFQELFTTSNPTTIEPVVENVDRVVTPLMNQQLLQPYTAKEVKQALFQMRPSMSPRPDGMSPFFFQKFWHVVGGDVTNAVLSFLH